MTAHDPALLASGTVLFLDGAGNLYATVIVKATYALRHGALATPAPPLALNHDVCGEDGEGSLVLASDFAPFKLCADVLVTGHIHPRSSGLLRQAVGFAIARGPDVLLRKRMIAVGARDHVDAVPETLAVSPLAWERSLRGRDNPVGSEIPSVVDPDDPRRAAGTGPIAPTWPARASYLTKEQDAALRADPIRLAHDFDLRFFQCAPPDQQLPRLLGGEQILLIGVHPEHPEMICRLPALHAFAQLEGPSVSLRDVPLRCDTLWIDVDRGVACLTFRGFAEVAAAALAPALLRAQQPWVVHSGMAPCENVEEVVGTPREWSRSAAARSKSPTVDPVAIDDESGLVVGCFSWSFDPGKPRRVVVVKGTFALAPEDGVPALSPHQDELRGDEPAAAEAGAELTYASDYTPFKAQTDVLLRGTAHAASGQTAALVRLEVGPLVARLVALGPRSFDASGFPGAPGAFVPVPLRYENAFGGPGVPANPAGTGFAPGSPPPRLEDPDRLIRSRADQPVPACFGPVAPSWPARSALLGSFDRTWQRERWPHFPADFDPAFFQAAPARLRVGELQGNERFQLDGVRPGGGGFTGALPGVRPRVFAVRQGGEPFEVVVRLDTVLFDTDAGRVLLTWRGSFEVEHPSGEIERLVILREPLDTPRSRGEIAAQFAALAEPRLAPSRPSDAMLPARVSRLDVFCFGEHMRRAAPGVVAAGGVFAARAASATTPLAPPKPPSRTEVEALVRDGKGLAGRDLTEADLRGVDLSRQDLRGAILARAKLAGARFDGTNLAAANLSAIDAPDSTWNEADLSRADLTKAILLRADFTRARLEGASLAGAQLQEAVLADAKADGADFSGADLSRCKADGVSFAKADLSGARFCASSLRRAVLDDLKGYDAVAEAAVLDEASLRDARFENARFAGASLRGAAATGSVWECADLSRATLRGADLTGAILAGARLVEADLRGAFAQGATFHGADLTKAVLEGADLMKASFEGACLSGGRLRGASLYGAELRGADLEGADLTLALVGGPSSRGELHDGPTAGAPCGSGVAAFPNSAPFQYRQAGDLRRVVAVVCAAWTLAESANVPGMSLRGATVSHFVAVFFGLTSLGGCGLALGLGDFQDAPAGAGGSNGSSSSSGTGGTHGTGGTGTGGTGMGGTGGTATGGSGGSGGTTTTCVGGVATCVDKTTCGAATECHAFDCASSCCADVFTPDGTALVDGQTAEDCQKVVCDGKGGTTIVADPTDVPPAIDACHTPSCSGMDPKQTPIAGACTLNGLAAVCGDPKGLAAGTCVECNTTNDCTGGKGCVSNACVPAKCNDKVQDGDETDVDCGGSCLPCAVGLSCLVQADCAPGYCKNQVCAGAACNDSVKDGDETDIDCGGSCPAKCAPNQGCLLPKDCETGPHGAPTCNGTCGFGCDAGFADCDAAVGCEMDVTTPAHCGACNVACSAYCVNGACNDPIVITGGYEHHCAILKDGGVYCWGFNQEGEVGDGTTGNRANPVKVVLPDVATAIAAGGVYLGGPNYSAHTCAILADQSVWCWGNNANGELGQGNVAVYTKPVKVNSLASINRISVGGGHTCAANVNNDLYCWGYNANGQVGTGPGGAPVTLPQVILAGATAKLGLGRNSSCIIKNDGKIYCWGLNTNGQLGSGNLSGTNVPGPAVAGITGAIEVVGGGASTCARNASNVYCWGRNTAGELGLGNVVQQVLPQVVGGLANVSQLAFSDHVGAVTAGGIYMWGPDGDGQLGDGFNTSFVNAPELVAPLSTFTKLGLSDRSSCGLTAAHQMSCWGYNAYGQLGNGGFASSSIPVAVAWP